METCAAIILAAGNSGRMGEPKSDLPWLGGQALLPWLFGALGEAGWATRVVLSPAGFARWQRELPSGAAILNPRPEQGKITSLVAGVNGLPADARWILITSVDQPRPPALYRRMRECLDGKSLIVMPDNLGHRGHPIVVSAALRKELSAVTEANFGLRGFLDAHRDDTHRLPGFDCDWLRWDFNTPAEYREALAYFEALPETCRSKRNSRASAFRR